MKKIKLTESQYAELKKGVVNENMELDELMSYNDYANNEQFQVLRDALNKGKVVSVAFVKKDGTPRAGVFRKTIGAYQYSTRPKSDAQLNVKENHGLMNAIDVNAYKKALAETGDPALASKGSWRYVTLANVIGFLASGQFIDMREENEILTRFGEDAYNFLTKSMQSAMNRAQQQAENDPEVVGNEPNPEEIEPQITADPVNEPVNDTVNTPETEEQPLEEWSLEGKDDDYLSQNEYQTSYEWINHFGGAELLRNNGINNGYMLLRALKDGRISIEDIDDVTAGAHGQEGDIPFSETGIGKNIVIPHMTNYKNELPLEEEDEALNAHEKARTMKDESMRTMGFGYHGGIEAKSAGKAGNRRDLYESIEEIKKWNKILLENYVDEDNSATNQQQNTQGTQQPDAQSGQPAQPGKAPVKQKMDVQNLNKSSSITQQQTRAQMINNPQEYVQAFEGWVKSLGIEPGKVSKNTLLTLMNKKLTELGF